MWTMISLRIAGALDRSSTFDLPIDIVHIAQIEPDEVNRSFVEENLQPAGRCASPTQSEVCATAWTCPAETSRHDVLIVWPDSGGARRR